MALELRYSGEDKDMTFDELAAFVEQARSNGVDGSRNVYAELSTSGKVKVLNSRPLLRDEAPDRLVRGRAAFSACNPAVTEPGRRPQSWTGPEPLAQFLESCPALRLRPATHHVAEAHASSLPAVTRRGSGF
jgi:hypothetical protein